MVATNCLHSQATADCTTPSLFSPQPNDSLRNWLWVVSHGNGLSNEGTMLPLAPSGVGTPFNFKSKPAIRIRSISKISSWLHRYMSRPSNGGSPSLSLQFTPSSANVDSCGVVCDGLSQTSCVTSTAASLISSESADNDREVTSRAAGPRGLPAPAAADVTTETWMSEVAPASSPSPASTKSRFVKARASEIRTLDCSSWSCIAYWFAFSLTNATKSFVSGVSLNLGGQRSKKPLG